MLDEVSPAPESGSLRREALAQRLAEEIDLARIAPEQSVTFAQLARRIGCRPDELPSIVAKFVESGLIRIVGGACIVAPVDRAKLVENLDRRLGLEISIVQAAALRRGPFDEQELAEAMALLERCALVGDIEGYGVADRRMDAALAAAANLPEETAELVRMKREFRRAWCAYNRLRDLNAPVRIRRDIAGAVVAGDAEAARAAVVRFLAYLRQAY